MIAVSGVGDLIMGLGGTALAFAVIVLLIMAILMPYYVYKIRHETARTNKLLEQLLKAYGHDPES